ncbi:MAG: hypothetical protein H6819_02360 [Phycisphaerales bacterium]|nr:hypothetical protein [Phycisphaerales bacterium]MCB9856944.1 hypothetical protein [Phycisphaerales bacterium]MCB9861929.1 hypothetical protein [Phycisphaerales bacterium]
MPRTRPASNPISFHKPSGQYYTTRRRRRVYLGTDYGDALARFYRLELGLSPTAAPPIDGTLTVKELASRYILAQQANWRNPKATAASYKSWLKLFLNDHPRMLAADFTVERFSAWKIALRQRRYAPETINHCLSAVRAIYAFAADAGLMTNIPRLRRVRNERCPKIGSHQKPLYSPEETQDLLNAADVQLRAMILLALNCGFGPKDIRDLTWDDMEDGRATLPRSKTGICQTYGLWPETLAAIDRVVPAPTSHVTVVDTGVPAHANG